MNLGAEFLATAEAQPDQPALLLCGADGARSISAGSLRRQVLACAGLLHSRGLRAGALVLQQGAEPLDDLVLMLALTLLGVGSYAPARATEAERQVVKALGLQQVVTPRGDNPFGLQPVEVDPGLFSGDGLAPAPDPPLLADDGAHPWLVRSTSGTTGTPKVFVTSHAQAISRRDRYREAVAIGPGDVFCSLTPLRFGAARQRVLYALGAGATVLVQPEDALQALLRRLQAWCVTHLYAVPMHLELLCDLAAAAPAASPQQPLLPTLKSLETSSATVAPALRAKVRACISPHLHISYSVSEVGHLTSTACSTVPEDEVNSVGRPLRGVELAVFGSAMQPQAPGVSGAIGVRLPAAVGELRTLQADGSWRLETQSGWFFPGDVGCLSAHGNLILQGRSDDLMICNGINIFPAEIEAVARAHPAVKEAAAFAVASRIHQDIPCVAVVWADEQVTPDLAAHFSRHLGARSPRCIFFVPALPRNDMGKVLLRQLRQRAVEQLRKAPAGLV